jgi:hypothetical protein
MGRPALPDYAKLDSVSPLRLRGTPPHREVWREIAAEFGISEASLARIALLILMRSIARYEPLLFMRALMRVNRTLASQNYPSVTNTEILDGMGLPEQGLLTITDLDEELDALNRSKKLFHKLLTIAHILFGIRVCPQVPNN